MTVMPTIVVEEDRVLRLVQVILDPQAPRERCDGFADYMAHDVPDFAGWCRSVREQAPSLYPARVRLISTQEQLRAELPAADVLIVESLEVGRAELALAPRLRLVQQFGHQQSHVDSMACAARNIPVRNLRRRTNLSVAEHTMALMLALAKRMPLITGLVTRKRLAAAGRPFRSFDRSQTANANFGRIEGLGMLRGAELGLLGFGEIGCEVAAMAQAFGMRVSYHRRHRLTVQDEQARGVTYCSFEELFARADFLSVHVPLADETRDLVDAGALSHMKPGAFLINTSRAEIIERGALLAAVTTGTLGGAALDVLYDEPLKDDDPLLASDRVLMTPHLAGGTRLNGLTDMAEMLADIGRAVASAAQ
jgi:phosphoglycerate dehydrogenase-like enzyme